MMKVLNAGLEKIEFGFNQNAKSRKEGGFYQIEPGEQMDIPEMAEEAVMHPLSGPHLRGLVILNHGDDQAKRERDGLETYRIFISQCIDWESQRQEEKRQVGYTNLTDGVEMRRFKDILAKIEDKLNGNTTSNGNQGTPESERSSGGSPKVSVGNNKKSA